MAELRSEGISFTEPSDPLNDREFIGLLTSTWELSPSRYPAEAPVNMKSAA